MRRAAFFATMTVLFHVNIAHTDGVSPKCHKNMQSTIEDGFCAGHIVKFSQCGEDISLNLITKTMMTLLVVADFSMTASQSKCEEEATAMQVMQETACSRIGGSLKTKPTCNAKEYCSWLAGSITTQGCQSDADCSNTTALRPVRMHCCADVKKRLIDNCDRKNTTSMHEYVQTLQDSAQCHPCPTATASPLRGTSIALFVSVITVVMGIASC